MVSFGLSPPELIALVVVVVLIIIVVAIFLYLARRLRARRDQLIDELSHKPELVQDRAYNRLAMARREAEIVERTGSDIGAAQGLIAQSQAAYDLRQYARSYELAQSAHEALVAARGKVGRAGAAPQTADSRPLPSSGARGALVATPTTTASAPPLAKNRAESHFMIGLLAQDLQTAPAGTGPTLEGQALYTQSQAAFDRGEYAESFRLALKGRRALGGRVEALAATPHPGSGIGGPPGKDPEGLAESFAGTTRCPDCGHPIPSGDVFCRGCGKSLLPSTCAACGAPRAATDVFCGKCGASFSS